MKTLANDLNGLDVTIKACGSLVEGTRGNLCSKPTLDLLIFKDGDAFALREQVAEMLKLTTAEIRIRDAQSLLSEKYPCITCEDNKVLHVYKVRLIFGLREPNVKIKTDMWIVFKSWAQYNLGRSFTSLEIWLIFCELYKENDSFYDVLKKLIETDPVQGIKVGQSLEQ